MNMRTGRSALLAFGAALLLTTGFTGIASADEALTLLVDNGPQDLVPTQALVKAFIAKNPGVSIDIEQRPGGAEGDNIIRTRLATDDMDDIFVYNSGSQLMGTNPDKYLVDLSGEPWQANVVASFKNVVTANGHIFGAPLGGAQGGGVLYNKTVFAAAGITSVPKSWTEFMADAAKIKAAGKVPVIQSFKDTWTSQLFLLGDFFNVSAAEPNFATDYTAAKIKFATDPVVQKGFQHQVDVLKAGDLNPDYAAASYDDAIKMLSNGGGAMYPMLTFAIAAIQTTYPDKLKDIGFFALPGDDASKNGLTTWEPAGFYIPKASQHIDTAKKFVAFVASKEGCDIQTAAVGITGPYLIKGCDLPATVPPAVADLASYFKSDETNSPALEFLSPIKGPALEQITVQVGSGISTPADAAALYDDDVKKQAQQLGLPGW
jgi:raffinose/stachyose/melibiose transport system substrate-binding protein